MDPFGPEIPIDIQETFHRALGLAVGEDVPEGLLALYKDLRFMMDVIGGGDLRPVDLCMLAILDRRSHKKAADVGKPIPLKPGDKISTVVQGLPGIGVFVEYFENDSTYCKVKIDDDAAEFRSVKITDTVRR